MWLKLSYNMKTVHSKLSSNTKYNWTDEIRYFSPLIQVQEATWLNRLEHRNGLVPQKLQAHHRSGLEQPGMQFHYR